MSVNRVPMRGLRAMLAVVAASALSACDVVAGGGLFGRAQASDQWNRHYDLAPGGRLEIINVNGRIIAEPAPAGSGVDVRADRTARAASEEAARELLPSIEIREEAGSDRVRLEVRVPRMSGLSGHEVVWTLRVPPGVSVDLRTVNGRIEVSGLDGEVRAETTNGAIAGRALRAKAVDANTTNGSVDIELASAVTGGTFELEAVNGSVSLKLPANSRAHIQGRCVNGGISASGLDLQMVGEQTRRRLEATLNGGGAHVMLSTVNGGVRIGAAEEATP